MSKFKIGDYVTPIQYKDSDRLDWDNHGDDPKPGKIYKVLSIKNDLIGIECPNLSEMSTSNFDEKDIQLIKKGTRPFWVDRFFEDAHCIMFKNKLERLLDE